MYLTKKWEIMSLSKELWAWIDPYQNIFGKCTALISAIFTLLPDGIFEHIKVSSYFSDYVNIICLKIALAMVIAISIYGVLKLLRDFGTSRLITGRNYSIEIQYGNLFDKEKNGKIVISFDECFTTLVNETDPGAINPGSICGQFLKEHPLDESTMEKLILSAKLKPLPTGSNYKGKIRYETGSIVPMGSKWLLLAFTKLNKDGRAAMSHNEYVQTLAKFWEELDKYYSQEDIYIPILGTGTTRIDSNNYSSQELLDIIISSYKLSPYKLRRSNKLHIVCRNDGEISLAKIGREI